MKDINPVIETIDETSSVETKSIIILITFKLTPRERASSSDSDNNCMCLLNIRRITIEIIENGAI